MMVRSVFFTYVFCSVLLLSFFPHVQILSIEAGLGWTFSMLFPYLLLLILGFLLAKTPPFNLKSKALKFTFQTLIFALPFAVGFSLNPIYRDDFRNQAAFIETKTLSEEFKRADLIVVTITGCPFCKASCKKMNLLKQRNPDLKITYLVLSNSVESEIEFLVLLNPEIRVQHCKSIPEILKISGNKFPVFLTKSGKHKVKKWLNSDFGYPALDELEN